MEPRKLCKKCWTSTSAHMVNLERYPYQDTRNHHGESLPRPILPLTIRHGGQALVVNGLLDTGATVNVLPLEIGQALGIVWNEPRRQVALTGNLARYTAKVIPLIAQVAQFPPVPLIFAWTEAENVPL